MQFSLLAIWEISLRLMCATMPVPIASPQTLIAVLSWSLEKLHSIYLRLLTLTFKWNSKINVYEPINSVYECYLISRQIDCIQNNSHSYKTSTWDSGSYKSFYFNFLFIKILYFGYLLPILARVAARLF